MTHYYIIGLVADDEDEYIWETDEKDFYDQMKDNWHIAKDNGDAVPGYRNMINAYKHEHCHEEAFNAFSFLKLTNMTPQEWGY